MASTYTSNLRLELQATGEHRSTWGSVTNAAVISLVEAAITGYESIAMANTNVTLTTNNGSTDQARKLYLNFTGTNAAIRNVTIPTVSKMYIMTNSTTGGFAILVTNGVNSINITNGQTALVWTDGTAMGVHNISSVGDFSTITTSGLATLNSAAVTNALTVGTTLGVTGTTSLASLLVSGTGLFTGSLFGLRLSNYAGDLTNDIEVAVGSARNLADTYTMILSSALIKRIDAPWAVGTNQGMLATGVAVTNTTYHIFLIRRPDTGVVDIAADTSVTGANIVTNTNVNYTHIRRIGSIVRIAGFNQRFYQIGDKFLLNAPVVEVNLSNPGVNPVTPTLTSIPAGLEIDAMLSGYAGDTSPVTTTNIYISSPNQAATSPGIGGLTMVIGSSAGDVYFTGYQIDIMTNTSRQIRYEFSTSTTGHGFYIQCNGWIDTRGRFY